MDAKAGARRKNEAGDTPNPEGGERQPTRIQAINREIILDAALEVFAVHGFRGSTVDQIAARADMSKPNLLYYYRRKQDIYRAVLEATLGDWLAPLAAIDPAGDPIEELRRYISLKLAMSAEKPAASRLFANEILAGAPVIGDFLETRLRALVQEKAGVIRRWVGEGRLAPVDPVHLIFTIWAVTQHYADFDVQVKAVLGSQVDAAGFREQTAQAVLSIVLNGIRPRR
ncbi:TetR family transcriptional regulator C-terminal domain-containing protein [Jiella sonneratiae]|uniref:TetR family transcriptional regulator C-terminal domain-containing protein n=1 Tax=Jiella sonneratiae TaxID=2816856 RepID=A0ABS3JBC8_9HYPH|nr:TetR family transcriptional regulator C-terminal domain-containing protein [Jiella sonneratiae]MBO0906457.1 TetR family transcriptional regulator C-terminal domain-containing protein [Jiella sonneratiae]